jgi:hypothetical protein
MGPANIVMIGATSLVGVGFSNCDVCIIKPNTPLHNCIAFDTCAVHGGFIHACTIYVDSKTYNKSFKPLGAVAVTYDIIGQ